MSTRRTLLLLSLGLGIVSGSVACKGGDDGDDGVPPDSGTPDLGPKDTGADGGVDTGVDGGVDTGVDGGTEDTGADGGADDLGRLDGGDTSGPGVVFRVFDVAGDPIENASIEVNGGTATTDANGVAFIPNLAGEQLFVVSHTGHQRTPFSYEIPSDTRVQIDATLHELATEYTLDDAMFSMFGANGNLGIIANDALETTAGADITGSYQARLLGVDVSQASQVLGVPLPFVGRDAQGNEHPIEAFGVFEVSVTQNGAPLRVKQGAMAAVSVAIPAAVADLVQVDDVVPAWSYDEATGRWVEEQDGTIQNSPFGGKIWQGFFTHFSWWAVARPFDGTCLDARASNAGGAPVTGALVRAVGLDHGYVGARFTDSNGDTCIQIKPSGNVGVSAVHESYASLATPVIATGALTPGSCGGGSCGQAPLTLEGPACVAGSVLDEQGAPYANARIQTRYQNSSGQLVSSFTNTDAQGEYCAPGPIDTPTTIVASDLAFTDSASVSAGSAEAVCSTNCSTVDDLILADFVGACVHGLAEIYEGMGNPAMQAPVGTPIYVYSGADFTPSCAPGADDPATWGTLVQQTTVGANGLFCVSAIPLGPTLVVLGDCTVWPSETCGPAPGGGSFMNPAVCGQPDCVDLGTLRFNMVCDGGN